MDRRMIRMAVVLRGGGGLSDAERSVLMRIAETIDDDDSMPSPYERCVEALVARLCAAALCVERTARRWLHGEGAPDAMGKTALAEVLGLNFRAMIQHEAMIETVRLRLAAFDEANGG